MPPLCTPKDVGARILLQQRTEAAKAAADSVAMEMDSESEGDEDTDVTEANIKDRLSLRDSGKELYMKNAHEVTQPAPAAPIPSSVVIRDYDPKKGFLFYIFF